VRRFRHNDLEHLEKRLRLADHGRRVIAVDGINSMTGNPPDLPALADLARRYDALLYIDDAHGFGVIGERAPGDPTPYGRRGNALVRHFDESYDHIVLTGGMSKAYSSLAAFVACPEPVKRLLKLTAASYSYSGPSPVASLASTLIGLEVNARRGDELRTRLYRLTRRVLDHVQELGGQTSNTSAFPIIQLPLADPGDLVAVGDLLFARGIFALLVPHPIVPHSDVGIRLQLTAANTDEQVIQLLAVLTEIDERFGLRRADLEAPERALAALMR
jgi:8-amino-7-oxononanoate synthase